MELQRPQIKKLGTIDCDVVETTPIVFKGQLYRFEYIRDKYKPNTTGDSYFRFVEVGTGKATPGFAEGYHLGSAHVEDDTVYVYGVKEWGGNVIQVFRSKDLEHWSAQVGLTLPGYRIYNNSACRGKDRFFMAIEIDEPKDVVGVPYTMVFAESFDLLNWNLLPTDRVYTKDRYSACPALRYVDGWYYMIYLEAFEGPCYNPHIVRTRDFIGWENSPVNPVLHFSPEDKHIANPKLTPQQRDHIARAVDINNSDVDLCEYKGKTVIIYSWGDQLGIEFLAEAFYDGPLTNFLQSWFPR
jgi:hypothetical protein